MTNEELSKQYIALDERVTRHTEQIKSAFNQIGETKAIAESVHKLATTVELLVREQKDTNQKVDKVINDVEEIKEKPAHHWNSLVTVILTAIVSGFVTYVFTRLGM